MGIEHGMLLLSKPQGITSQTAVTLVKRALHLKKAGHTGTLDPLATGLLIVLMGKATKLAPLFAPLCKEYAAEFELGKTTNTYDSTGNVIAAAPVPDLSLDALRQAAQRFTGLIEQVPPLYSAKKIHGKRLYAYARKNIPVQPKSHRVRVHTFEITGFHTPRGSMRVVCSSGTYIRSLIHDMGTALGCGAIMTALERMSIGPFLVRDAVLPEMLASNTVRIYSIEETRAILERAS